LGTNAGQPLRARNLLAFGIVGCSAAAVHLGIVSAIVPFGLPPLLANVIGFAGAFGVSFTGHNYLTFPAAGRAKRRAALRFLLVACSSFALNESLYWLLLRTGLDYRIALVLVLGAVAALTLLASRYWAFADA
jgi:putative flippase GtrA